MTGWIKLHRKVKDNWLFQEKRVFSKFEAWIDLLMRANHKDNKIVLGNELIDVAKGQFITSEIKLMESWRWGKSKTRNFLELLEKDGMIIKKSDRKKTTITICNYSIYHDNENENRPQADRKQTATRPLSDTDKNVKNEKNDKEHIPYAEIVKYLNEKANKKFRPSSQKTKDQIKARWNEGHRIDDFKKVIDVCCQKWKGQIFSNGQAGDTYLQPSTLFNQKFDERLNWSVEKAQESKPKKSRDQIEHEKMLNEMGYFDD